MFKFGSAIVPILASLNMSSVFAQQVKENVFTVPQTCFGSGKMGVTTTAKSNVADLTNTEELFSDVFE